MRIGVGQLKQLDEETLKFAAQLGATGIQLNTPELPGETRWEYAGLLRHRRRVEAAGLELFAVEATYPSFYDRALLGLPGRDEQIEDYCATIRNVGRAGIPMLGFHWMTDGVWRTSRAKRGRGGARVVDFDLELAQRAPLSHGRNYSAEEMWANLGYFLDAVMPVAEAAGVRLAVHPDDPPVPLLGGVGRALIDFDALERLFEMAPSPNLSLQFCTGTWSAMMGADCLRAVRYFAERDRICYVHFRDVRGTAESFEECFLGEGNLDLAEVIRTLHDAGFDGYLIDDHVPGMVNDSAYGHRARAHAVGYMSGLIATLD
jgi:mannonate dehydratase